MGGGGGDVSLFFCTTSTIPYCKYYTMLSYYNKYYTRLQVLYYATLALGYTFQGRMKGGGGFKHPPPPPILSVREKEKGFKGGGGYLLTYFRELRFFSGGVEVFTGGVEIFTGGFEIFWEWLRFRGGGGGGGGEFEKFLGVKVEK